jgi:hypothetical protein
MKFLTNFLTNILMNFDFSVDFSLTYYLLIIASFRIGVPSILFFLKLIMIYKQELSPQNGHYTPLLCFHLSYIIEILKSSTNLPAFFMLPHPLAKAKFPTSKFADFGRQAGLTLLLKVKGSLNLTML